MLKEANSAGYAANNPDSRIDSIRNWAAVSTVFAAPFSRALFIMSASLFTILWILSPGFIRRLNHVSSVAVTLPAFTLLGIVVIGFFLSSGNDTGAINNIRVYSKLMLMLMLAECFSDLKHQRRGFIALVAGMSIVLISTYLNVIINLPWSKSQNQGLGFDHSVFVDYVSQGVITSVFFGYCVLKSIEAHRASSKISLAWGALAILSAFSVLFLLQGRSGAIGLLVMLLVIAVIQFSWRTSLLALFAGSGGIAVAAFLSPIMSKRISMGLAELMNYEPFERTSIAWRIDMWQLAYRQWMDNFWLGTGGGAYAGIAEKHFGYCESVCIHPHNQYLFLAMEYGVVALVVYLWLLLTLAIQGLRSKSVAGALMVATTALIALDSLYNVPLWYRAQSYFLYTFLGLLIGGILVRNGSDSHSFNPARQSTG